MPVQRTSRLRGLTLALLAFALAIPTQIVASTIGLYSDENGSSCSFSGNAAGVVKAYVVIRPDAEGVRGVRFSAPVPACLAAVWVSDVVSEGALVIGASETGISISTPMCSLTPASVLEINYYRSGSTTPCCRFSILPDPITGIVEAATCTFNSVVMTPVTSHFNADETCPCSDDVAPMPPSDPIPYPEQTFVAEWPTFSWVGADWDGDIAEYDLYLGTTPAPSLAAAGLTTSTWEPAGPLAPVTTYYWRVVARDATGLETSSPVWYFRTRTHNHPPSIRIVSPFTGSTAVPIQTTLTWTASDVDGDGMLFDVYFGTSNPPPFVAGRSTQSYPLPLLQYDTVYYWRVVARDGPHSETSTPIVLFTTRNAPPLAPSSPAPANGALNVALDAVMSWNSADPAGEPTTCDLYFGTTDWPPLVAQNIVPDANNVATFDPGGLVAIRRYYWRVVVRDIQGQTTSGPTWSFVTPGNTPPSAPSNPAPPDGATGHPPGVLTLRWMCSDPDGHALKYDVYLGTMPSPPLVTNTDNPSAGFPFAEQTKYYWRVVAKDGLGGATSGPTWSFTTGGNTPPSVSNPYPPDGSTINATAIVLTWTGEDPDPQTLTYLVYFGTSPSPPFVGPTTSAYFNAGPLTFGHQYYWKIIARDGSVQGSSRVWTFSVGAEVPVLFSRFGALVHDGAVHVSWELQGDEALASYTIFRGVKGASQRAAVAEGKVAGTTGSYLDRTAEAGKTYQYEMLVRTSTGDEFRSQLIAVEMASLELALGANHPNPFNPQTTIPYSIPVGSAPVRVRLAIYDTSGRLVRELVDETQTGGARDVVWRGDGADGKTVTSGVYFSVLQVGNERRTRKLVLLK